MSAADVIAARIHREGSITFDAFMEHALYEPEHGFFALGLGAGRAGRDFVTSPEVGSLFGACLARAIDRTWDGLGRPDPFLVVEPGAGTGRLARDISRAEPVCLTALRYVLIERSATLRARQHEILPIEPADEALGPFALLAAGEDLVPVPRAGPVFAAVADLPEMPVDTVVVANELLDNLPFGIAEWDGARWDEIRVAIDGSRFVEIRVPAAAVDASALSQVVEARDLPPGTRVPIPRGIVAWLDECAHALHTGVVTLIDYVVGVDELLGRGDGWLRTYRAHGRGAHHLEAPGSQDITADVLREQMQRAALAAGFTIVDEQSQGEWLRDLGLDELVVEGRRAWDAGAARGDLAALAGRSRIAEAAALTDAAGLGAHQVVTLAKAARTTASQHR